MGVTCSSVWGHAYRGADRRASAGAPTAAAAGPTDPGAHQSHTPPSPQEDARLCRLVHDMGVSSWKAIGEAMGDRTGACARARGCCQHRLCCCLHRPRPPQSAMRRRCRCAVTTARAPLLNRRRQELPAALREPAGPLYQQSPFQRVGAGSHCSSAGPGRVHKPLGPDRAPAAAAHRQQHQKPL